MPHPVRHSMACFSLASLFPINIHAFVWHVICILSFTGVKRSRRTDAPKGFHKDDKDEAECAICHLYLHASGLECDCCPGRRVCLQHADNLCECDPTRWRLVYRYSLQDLSRILQQVCSHIPGEGTISNHSNSNNKQGFTLIKSSNATLCYGCLSSWQAACHTNFCFMVSVCL